ncbi:DUF1249 domain-containing protein [Exilibacterium tricleocarpae]|uniref:DUF1249 domain-containing protein n=1 Tax=Exilibacterium tricleocarpae TaxID=2591008 RepID=A0A545TFG3_9GAMM|nr:DUF1249 domain-containing protein [Exilibacterium tricleocarpae]TQV75935.1 DUF1249 domain-containing protein [Exilibacterium tricleocarpae]
MKPRYRVDLPGQLAVCEANYLRLLKLTPDLPGCERWRFAVGPVENRRRVDIAILERARYTTTVELAAEHSPAGELPAPVCGFESPRLKVRLYHDAQMAEVIAWEDHRLVQPRYDYPNRRMYQSDEKAQMNRFLGEWLSYCLEQGYALEDVRTFGLVG